MHSPTGCHSYGDNCPPCEGACLSSLAPSSSSGLSHESTQLRVPNELSNCKKYLFVGLKSLISVFSLVLPMSYQSKQAFGPVSTMFVLNMLHSSRNSSFACSKQIIFS